MSRLIVKNLPKHLTEEQFRQHFAKQGEVTDAKLMKTPRGVSRRFGFIGYRTEEAAQAALRYFDKTFVETSKITVEKAVPYGSSEVPRAWSKYTEGTSANKRLNATKKEDKFKVEETDAYKDQQRKKQEHIAHLKEEESNPKLKEYLDVMTSRSKSKTWANDDTTVLNGTNVQGVDKMDIDENITHALPAGSDDELYDDLPSSTVKKRSSTSDSANSQPEKAKKDDVSKVKDTEKEGTSGTGDVTSMSLDDGNAEDMKQETSASAIEQIQDTGRLFVRNLPYTCTENDLKEAFSKFGPLSEVHMPIARDSKQPKGYAYILYLIPEDAVKAYRALDMQPFQGRLLHILPGKEKVEKKEEIDSGINGAKLSSVKKEKERKRKALAGSDFNWNSLYMSSDAVAASIADRLGVAKSELLNPESSNMAVRLALAETQIIAETKEFFEQHGICLDTFGKKERSDNVILVKNIPYGTSEEELGELFGKFGELGRVLIPPAKTIAIVEFLEPSEARVAFRSLAYRRFKDTLIYLEKAPSGLFSAEFDRSKGTVKVDKPKVDKPKVVVTGQDLLESTNSDEQTSTLFVKNLNFSTKVEDLRKAFSGIEGYRSSRINCKPDPVRPGVMKSMGYGFVEFSNKEAATKALNAMQGYVLDGHALSLKFSHNKAEKTSKEVKPESTKIVVRNVPFEATAKELRELFSAYGQLKSLRMPKKFTGGHRGFAFLDFMTKQEAKNVFENMANIHIYGRHLVLEWAKDEDDIDKLRQKTGKSYAAEESFNGRVTKRQKVNLDDEDEEMLE